MHIIQSSSFLWITVSWTKISEPIWPSNSTGWGHFYEDITKDDDALSRDIFFKATFWETPGTGRRSQAQCSGDLQCALGITCVCMCLPPHSIGSDSAKSSSCFLLVLRGLSSCELLFMHLCIPASKLVSNHWTALVFLLVCFSFMYSFLLALIYPSINQSYIDACMRTCINRTWIGTYMYRHLHTNPSIYCPHDTKFLNTYVCAYTRYVACHPVHDMYSWHCTCSTRALPNEHTLQHIARGIASEIHTCMRSRRGNVFVQLCILFFNDLFCDFCMYYSGYTVQFVESCASYTFMVQLGQNIMRFSSRTPRGPISMWSWPQPQSGS